MTIARILSVLAVGSFFALTQAGCLGSDDEAAAGSCNTSYVGTWKNACYDKGGGVYARDTLALTASAFTYTETQYSDATCATQSGTGGDTGTFTVGSAVTTPSGATAVDIAPSAADIGCGAGNIRYTVYQIKSDCKFYFGASSGGSDTGCTSAANRHLALETTGFTRQ